MRHTISSDMLGLLVARHVAEFDREVYTHPMKAAWVIIDGKLSRCELFVGPDADTEFNAWQKDESQ